MTGGLVIPAWMFASLVTVALALLGALWTFARAFFKASHELEDLAERLAEISDRVDSQGLRVAEAEKQIVRVLTHIEISGVMYAPALVKGEDR